MRVVVLSLVLLAALTACVGGDDVPDQPPSTVTFEGSDAVLHVDVADSVTERRQGLMGVEQLSADEGMAFVFGEPASTTFWMKDTLIPLSIAFVDERHRIVGLREMDPCDADPCPTYGVDRPYVLAIEANAGWFEDHGIGKGDRAELEVMAYQ